MQNFAKNIPPSHSKAILKILDATEQIGLNDNITEKIRVMVCEYLKRFYKNQPTLLSQVENIQGDNDTIIRELKLVLQSTINSEEEKVTTM